MVFIGYTLILFIEKVIFKIREHHVNFDNVNVPKIQGQNKEEIKENKGIDQKIVNSNSINRYLSY